VLVAFQSIDGIKVYVENLDAVFVLILMFSFAQLPFGYCCSFLFDTAASALTYLSLINITLGLLTMIIVSIIEVPGLDLQDVAQKLDYDAVFFNRTKLMYNITAVHFNFGKFL